MKYNLIFDMGGVLMNHNVRGSIEAFLELMGEEQMQKVLGLCANGEGAEHSMMEDFECGRISTEAFVERLRAASHEGTTREDVVAAWNRMHAGIPQSKLDQLRVWHEQGHHILLLSNNNPLHYEDIMTHYDMSMFDKCFFSHLMHVQKPNKEFYDSVEKYLQEQGWQGLPTCFVDDIAINRQIGEQYGWTTYESIEQLKEYLHA